MVQGCGFLAFGVGLQTCGFVLFRPVPEGCVIVQITEDLRQLEQIEPVVDHGAGVLDATARASLWATVGMQHAPIFESSPGSVHHPT